MQFFKGLKVFCTATCEIFYRTPAGYTADRKTRRKRNVGCCGLLSAANHHPPPPPHLPPSPPPTLCVCHTACGHVIRIRGLRESPPPTPPQDYGQILAASPKVEDGLHFGACEYAS
jgi:hypothetical protein